MEPGVAFIAKFCVNIAFLRCCTLLATSLCHRTQNNWTLFEQVMVHWWLLHHWTLDLPANSMSSQPWLYTHSSLAHTTNPVNVRRNLDNEITVQAAIIFIICCSSSLKNEAAYDVPIHSNLLWAANLLNVSTFSCADRHSFYYFHLLTLVSSVILALQVCALILGYAIRIFQITDANGVGWRKSLKGSTTPVEQIKHLKIPCLPLDLREGFVVGKMEMHRKSNCVKPWGLIG